MLLAVALLLGQFIPQQGGFINTSYIVNNNHAGIKTCEHITTEEDEEENNNDNISTNDETILLAEKNKNGKFLNIADKKVSKNESTNEGSASEIENNEGGEITNTCLIDDETADAHLQQLAYSIANDLGIITKVSINR